MLSVVVIINLVGVNDYAPINVMLAVGGGGGGEAGHGVGILLSLLALG